MAMPDKYGSVSNATRLCVITAALACGFAISAFSRNSVRASCSSTRPGVLLEVRRNGSLLDAQDPVALKWGGNMDITPHDTGSATLGVDGAANNAITLQLEAE